VAGLPQQNLYSQLLRAQFDNISYQSSVHVNIFTQTLQTLGGNGHSLCYQEGNNLATTSFIQELQIIKSTHKSCLGIGICSKSNTYTPGSGHSNEYILYSIYTLYFHSIKNNIFNIYIPSLIADSTTVSLRAAFHQSAYAVIEFQGVMFIYINFETFLRSNIVKKTFTSSLFSMHFEQTNSPQTFAS
jgi:hypothetical protein